MTLPIFVPSKCRPQSSTCRLLYEGGVSFQVVVEPQDAESYPPEWPQVVLPENDRGIAYVRQFILEANGAEHFWMLDDDITGFYGVMNRRCVRSEPGTVLTQAEGSLLAVPGLGQGAMEYQQFAWSAARPVKSTGYCDVAVLVDAGLCQRRRIRYRHEMTLKEDRDFTLQILASGATVARSCWTAFSAPANGSNAGGLADVYAQDGRELEACRRMAEAWPGICEPIVKPSGRRDLKIHWKKLAPKA